MHNMIVEDKGEEATIAVEREETTNIPNVSCERTVHFQKLVARHKKLRDEGVHHRLRNDLIEHICEREGTLEME